MLYAVVVNELVAIYLVTSGGWYSLLLYLLCVCATILHMNVYVCRDLKPENLLLSTTAVDATIKLADFGFAKRCKGDTLSSSLGSPYYIAPEILLRRRYGTMNIIIIIIRALVCICGCCILYSHFDGIKIPLLVDLEDGFRCFDQCFLWLTLVVFVNHCFL